MTPLSDTPQATIGRHNLLPGHVLRSEGHPFDVYGTRIAGRDGYALCSCGAHSPHLASHAARQRWHRTHKQHIVGNAS